MLQKRIKTEENKFSEAREDDGFSSSDGEFEKELARIDSYERRITLLRNQIRREKNMHTNKIAEKDEEIEKLKNIMMKQKIDLIKIEESRDTLELKRTLMEKDQQLQKKDQELQEMRQSLQRSHQLQLKNRELRTSNNQLHYIEQQLREKDQEQQKRLQEKDENILNKDKSIQALDKRLHELLAKNAELTSEINRLSDADNDFDVNNQTQMQSQIAYVNLERNSTPFFNDKHVVPKHLTAERHEYAKNYRFWDFDDGPIRYIVSNFNDMNFQKAYRLLGEMAQERVKQIFNIGRFVDKNGTRGTISSLILSHEKQLAMDFERNPSFTMSIRRMTLDEIQQNCYGQNNHFRGPRI